MASQKRTKHSKRAMKSTSTQTEDADVTLAMARLQEQVNLLTIENKVLRDHMNIRSSASPENNETLSQTNALNPGSATSSKGIKSCSCKGNCGTKICGCVKRKKKCTEHCKCVRATCQNQEKNDVNAENINDTNGHRDVNATPNRNITNRHLRRVGRSHGLFSPATEDKNVNINTRDYRVPSVTFSPVKTLTFLPSDNENEDHIEAQENVLVSDREPNEQRREIDKKLSIASSGSDKSSVVYSDDQLDALENDITFDPTKPKHQLIRTPPHNTSETKTSPILRPSEILLPIPIFETVEEEEAPSPPELLQPNVDWNQHQAQLVPCKKCKRKFLPVRIKKHETCCKGV